MCGTDGTAHTGTLFPISSRRSVAGWHGNVVPVTDWPHQDLSEQVDPPCNKIVSGLYTPHRYLNIMKIVK